MSDEKFFEELIREKSDSGSDLSSSSSGEGEMEVKLAKAENGKTGKADVVAKNQIKEKEYGDEPEGQLAIDVYQTPGEIVVEAAIAGVKPEDIDITATTDSVTIRGARHRDKETKSDDYFYQECYWGRFSRSVILPQEVDPEKSEVSFKNGILSVKLPKLTKNKQKKLRVKVE